MLERASVDNTPIQIYNYLMLPYIYFSDKYANKNAICLDIACGENLQLDLIKDKFKQIISMDIEVSNETVVYGDVLNIPLPDKSVDYVLCFETIEHTDKQKELIQELKRVTKKAIAIGSVNKTGPTHLDDVIIYKGKHNPFHVRELGIKEWDELFKYEIEFNGCYYGSVYRGEMKMIEGLSDENISNYVEIKL